MSSITKFSSSAARDRILSLTNHLQDSLNPADDLEKASMSTDYKFQGWMAHDKDSANGKMVWQEYEPKTWTESDVDIKVTHCGIWGSDLHTLRSGWVCLASSHVVLIVDDPRHLLNILAVLAMRSLAQL